MNREKRLLELSAARRVWDHDCRENTTAGLIELCRKYLSPTSVMAEVGCFVGVSTEIFALHAGIVYAIDPYTPYDDGSGVTPAMLADAQARFQEVCRRYPNVTWLKQPSHVAVREFIVGSLDLVYIDGDHGKAGEDIRLWLPKLHRPGGVMAGHDAGCVPFPAAGFPDGPDEMFPETSWAARLK
jgi:predicted O-methyltransferase YrrM